MGRKHWTSARSQARKVDASVLGAATRTEMVLALGTTRFVQRNSLLDPRHMALAFSEDK